MLAAGVCFRTCQHRSGLFHLVLSLAGVLALAANVLAGGTQACCHADGSCFNASSSCSDCINELDGVACFDQTVCDPNPCPQPGACCASDGSCRSVQADACSESFLGAGTSCEPNTCPQPGACCANDGTCTLALAVECSDYFEGEGSTCEPNICAQPGACCAEDGSCTFTTDRDCTGNFHGGGTICETGECPQPPTGACCDGVTCSEGMAEFNCAGSWLGDHSDCSPDPCFVANDSCKTAEPLTLGNAVFFSNQSANEDTTPECIDSAGDDQWTPYKGVWYSISVENDQRLTVSTCHEGTAIDTRLQIFSECNGTNPCVTGNDDAEDAPECELPDGHNYKSSATWCAEGGTTYYIIVGGYDVGDEYAGDIELTVSPEGPALDCAPPANDTCEGAEPLAMGESVTAYNGLAQTNDDTDSCAGITPYHGMWYTVVGDGGQITVSTCNDTTSFDTVIQVFCDCPYLGCVNGDDDACASSSEVSWCSESGKTYYVLVGGYGEDEIGYFKLSATPGESSCSPVENCSDQGACCVDATTCHFAYDQAGCSGTFLGVGTNCDGNPCIPTGACCQEDGGCAETAQADCVGNYQGDGTTCDPNLCPQPKGACCSIDGSCVVSTDAECAGEYQGNDSVCDPNPCPQPTGACCKSDGSCAERAEAECDGLGEYQGDFTTCDPNLCPQPKGACCAADGSCTVSTEDECAGSYQGNDTTCDPNLCPQPTGACCSENGSCEVTTEANCTGTYQGDGTACDPNPCPQPTGACCVADGSCSEITEAECEGFGEYQGDLTACEPNLCPQPTGACCSSGLCFERTEEECEGEYQGDGTTCDAGTCVPPVGACCFDDGNCSVENAFTCTLGLLGEFQGEGTVCDPNTCPQPPTGACCAEDTSCSETTEAACEGTFKGLGTECEPTLCARQIKVSTPENCAIDARIPFLPNHPEARRGYESFRFVFDGVAGMGEDDPEDFELTQHPSNVPTPPTIIRVIVKGSVATLDLSEPVHPGCWTCIEHIASGTERCVGYLPGDANSSRYTGPTDILEIVDNINGVRVPALQPHQCDIDRSGVCAPADILSEVDLLNGVTGFPSYNGASLPVCPSEVP